jgi:hypothetical protein
VKPVEIAFRFVLKSSKPVLILDNVIKTLSDVLLR